MKFILLLHPLRRYAPRPHALALALRIGGHPIVELTLPRGIEIVAGPSVVEPHTVVVAGHGA